MGTATSMMKHLATNGLVDYVPRSGVRLTPEGRLAALKVLRRHRLIEAGASVPNRQASISSGKQSRSLGSGVASTGTCPGIGSPFSQATRTRKGHCSTPSPSLYSQSP